MGGNLVCAHVSVADVVTVVDDGLGTVHEVTRGLKCHLVGIILCCLIVKVPLGNGILIQLCQCSILVSGGGTFAVLILGIDETAADTR